MSSPASHERSCPFDVGRYRLLVPIASGGMATVYLACARAGFDFEREVAVKLIHPHLRSASFEQQFIEEAKLAARIRHPNVVPTIDVGIGPAGAYLVMDYVEGGSLSRLMKPDAGVPESVLLRLLVEALRGLHAAHELCDRSGAPMNVVHRDFTPQNVLVGLDGVARLADFGIAKAVTSSQLTATGVVKGKFGYMSPEQARAQPLDRRSDVWAAGVIAWEIVARRSLHEQARAFSTLVDIVSDDPPRLSSLVPEVPVALEAIVAQALSRDVRSRLATAEALAESLERACRTTPYELAAPSEVVDEVRRVFGDSAARRRAQIVEAVTAEAAHVASGVTEVTQRRGPMTDADGAAPTKPLPAETTAVTRPLTPVTDAEGTAPTKPLLASGTTAVTRRLTPVTDAEGTAPTKPLLASGTTDPQTGGARSVVARRARARLPSRLVVGAVALLAPLALLAAWAASSEWRAANPVAAGSATDAVRGGGGSPWPIATTDASATASLEEPKKDASDAGGDRAAPASSDRALPPKPLRPRPRSTRPAATEETPLGNPWSPSRP